MRYYNYLNIPYQPAAEQLLYYLTFKRPHLMNPSLFSSWRNLDVKEVLVEVPELEKLFTPLGLTIHHMAIFVSSFTVGVIHIDHDLHSKCRINLPILNCDNSETRFYKTLVPPVKVLQSNGVPLLKLDPANCVLMDQFYLARGAVVFRNNEPHQVVSSNTSQPRISCTIGFNEDIEYLLQ